MKVLATVGIISAIILLTIAYFIFKNIITEDTDWTDWSEEEYLKMCQNNFIDYGPL